MKLYVDFCMLFFQYLIFYHFILDSRKLIMQKRFALAALGDESGPCPDFYQFNNGTGWF